MRDCFFDHLMDFVGTAFVSVSCIHLFIAARIHRVNQIFVWQLSSALTTWKKPCAMRVVEINPIITLEWASTDIDDISMGSADGMYCGVSRLPVARVFYKPLWLHNCN